MKKAETRQRELDLDILSTPRVRKPAQRFVGPAIAFVPDEVEQHFRLEYFKVLDTAFSQLFRLESLYSINIWKDWKHTSSRDADSCESLTSSQPQVNLVEPQRWQMVVDGIPEKFVFSAYYDAR